MDWSKVRVHTGPIPPGAVQVHLYDPQNMLRPRGTLKKESLSADLVEDLESAHEDWTDPKYGDSLTEAAVLEILRKNLLEEVEAAWEEFRKRLAAKGNKTV